jgi:uncharacterized protein with ParB-like and HNH nuclease domain
VGTTLPANSPGGASMATRHKDIEPVRSEREDAETCPADYEISTYPADFTLQVLYEKWKNKDILIPAFQRQFVWSQTQASKLIESFLVGLPVPGIFLYSEKRTENLLVLDGQQRLKSIFYYLEGFFGDEIRGRRPVFRLTGISRDSRYFNKSFQDLLSTDEPASKKLQNAVLRAFIIRQLDPADDTSVYHIFERLNTGGTLLRGQEIRNCIYGGKFNDMLVELNELESWRQVYGKSISDKRMRDVELILRFYALTENLENYETPMNDFLSDYLYTKNKSLKRLSKRDTNLQVEEYKSQFSTVIDAILETLGPKPFHVRAGLNAAVFDATCVAVHEGIGCLPVDLPERYSALVNDPGFIDMTTARTTDVETVNERVSKAKKILLG